MTIISRHFHRVRKQCQGKIKDLADEFVPNKENYNKDATLVGHGFSITYAMLDNLSLKPTKKQKQGWASKFGFSKK